MSKLAPGSTRPTSANLKGLTQAISLAFDGSDNLYVGNYTGHDDTVLVFSASSDAPIATLAGVSYPQVMAFDGKGNLFVANPGNPQHGTTVSEFRAMTGPAEKVPAASRVPAPH